MTADSMAAPVRRATVEVAGAQMLTDDEGRFSFNRLPAGNYFVLASKPGFLPASFGSKRPAGPGIGVEVRDGQPMNGLRLKLYRGSVLAGLVTDPSGQPVIGTEVHAFRYRIDMNTGERLPTPVTIGLGETITDDKGRYRLFGLEPGDYIISAAGPAGVSAVRMTTEPDVRFALQLLKLPPGAPLDSSIRRPPPAFSAREGAGVPVFYSSAESAGDAPRVTLGVAEERTDIDVVRRRVTAGSVTGNVSGPFATIRGGGKVHIIDLASPFTATAPWNTRDGGFGFGGLPAGHYELIAMSESTGFQGRSEAFVSGSEAVLSISLQPGATIGGRLVFLAASGQAADPSFVHLSLAAATRTDFPFRQTPLKPDGTFSWTAVPAGKYRLGVTAAEHLQPGWRAKSAMAGDMDLLDNVVTVTAAGLGDVVITLTDARSAITGTLQAPDGAPVSDYSILAFSADRTFWRAGSRRTQIVRPNSSGVFALRDLPEGDYLIVALADIETGQWHSAEFLGDLAPFAMKVSLADGEKKTLNIRINGG